MFISTNRQTWRRHGPPKFFEDMLEAVTLRHNVTVPEILGTGRARSLSFARWEAYYRLRKTHGLSLEDIGFLMNRDHTSVRYGVLKYEKLLAERVNASKACG